MRNVSRILACLFMLSVACRGGDRVPGHIIPREKMQKVLWDMMRADQFLGDYILNQDSSLNRKQESTNMYSQVLALHEVTQKQFRESFYYYRSRPDIFKVLMDSLSQAGIKPISPIDTQQPLIDTSRGK